MAPMKRKAAFAQGAGKKGRHFDKRVPTVIDALKDTEALPDNLRSLLKVSLPIALSACKVDRHAYEAEVVEQAQQALMAVQGALEQQHKQSLSKQNEVISPKERTARTKAKKDAEAHLEAVKAKLEANRATKKVTEKEVEDADSTLKAAQKEEKAAEKEAQKHANKKTAMSDVLANEFVMLKEGTSASAAGKKAVQKLVGLGREYGLDSTLLTTFPITCRKDVASRTEFEGMMFNSLQALIDGVITALSHKLAEAEPVVAAKTAAVNSANQHLDKAKAGLKAATEELEATHSANTEAAKEVRKADAFLRSLWEDMRQACEAQDELTGDLKNFKENIYPAFTQLKEKEPEPEPVEEAAPVEEPVEEAAAVQA